MLLPINKLQKIFKLESERNYDNRAVLGGIDKIIPSWESEARESHLAEDLIQQVATHLYRYPQADAQERQKIITEINKLLDPLQGTNSAQGSMQDQKYANSVQAEQPVNRQPTFEKKTTSQKPSSRFSKLPTESPPGLDSPLTTLTGVGPGNAKRLKEIGLYTLGDLLYYFPRRYDDYSQLKTINRLQYGEELTVIGTIQNISTRQISIRGKPAQITEAVLYDGTGFLRINWFNQPWIETRLPPKTQVSLSGKVEAYLGRLSMSNPDWELLEAEHLHTNRIVPVYPLTAGISQKWLRARMFQAVRFWAPRIPDYLPESVRQETGLLDLPTALLQIHMPDSMEQLHAARARLAFDEIFLLQLGVLGQKQSWQSAEAQVFTAPDGWLEQQIAHLPFALTNAQRRAIEDICADLASGHPMNRLLQGDVGSGKTVVAALAAMIVIRQGAQAAFMAPTSILAEQHYRSLSKLLIEQNPEPIIKPEQICLMIGDTPENEKQEIRARLADGQIKVVIGTHALIEDPVTFQDLQFVVIDEQHRFGVAQRSALRIKGKNPHLLVMTATPIPRSLALTVYGDLDLTVIDEMPAGRKPVETYILHPSERERAYHLIRSQIKLGQQAFIIYPLVNQGETDEVKAAVQEHHYLQKEIFPDLKLGLLHGRLRQEEKDRTMSRFRKGDFHILVSTSVVEVGVDVPNATVMLIEGANRFGLAQLHQLRGRVGRGQEHSYCLLIPDTENSLDNERLAVMAETNDGFVLAERDLEQRGPGEFLGTRQSGYSELRMANLTNIRLIEKARQQAQALFKTDPHFSDPKHYALAKMVRRFWEGGRGDIS
ncbi:MAG: ATP-dependent DNA helicase RecG [Anaerolineae bacterium]|nr:ATP-dependent DNA helicase RecG [Anaerolineae bacterium]